MNENMLPFSGRRCAALSALLTGAILPLPAQTLFDFESGTEGWAARAINATVERHVLPEVATSGSGVLAVTAGDDGWYQPADVTLQPDHAAHQAITEGHGAGDGRVLAFDVILDPEMDGNYRATRSNPWFNVNLRVEAGSDATYISQFTELGGIERWPDVRTTYTAEVPLDALSLQPQAPIRLILIFNNTEAYDFTVYIDNIRVTDPNGEVPGTPGGPLEDAIAYFGVTEARDGWIVLEDHVGWMQADHFPWLFSLNHGWLYVISEAPWATGTWLYDLDREDWWYSGGNGIYPWVFSANEGWIWIAPGG